MKVTHYGNFCVCEESPLVVLLFIQVADITFKTCTDEKTKTCEKLTKTCNLLTFALLMKAIVMGLRNPHLLFTNIFCITFAPPLQHSGTFCCYF